MDFFVPDYVRSLKPYVPGKPIEETKREFQLTSVIKLASNENPLGPGKKALAALKLASAKLHRYPDSSGFHLKKNMAESWGVSEKELVLGNGSNELIDLLVCCFSSPGDWAVVPQLAFIAFRICAQVHGTRILETPVNNDLIPDLDQCLKQIQEQDRVRMVYLANPNNPTGTYVSNKALVQFLQALDKLNQKRKQPVLVILDSAYWEYVTAGDFPDPMDLYRRFSNVIVLRTFSKIHGIAGLRLGAAIARPELVDFLHKVRQPFNVNSLALAAGAASLKDRAHIQKSIQLNRSGFKFWETQFDKNKIPFWKSQGNFILIDTSRGFGMRADDVFFRCLKRGVIFRPVGNYGMTHGLRISMGTPSENKRAWSVLSDEIRR